MAIRQRRPAADPRLWLAAAALAAGVGCAQPGVHYLPEALTPDGLQQVRSYRVWGAYAKPTLDLGQYQKVRFEFGAIGYRGTPRLEAGARPVRGAAPQTGRLTENDEIRLRRYFQETFEREFRKTGDWQLADAPGPDTLTVRAHALDMVAPVVATPRGSETRFSRRAPAFTIVLDVRDSVSNEPLARVVDRRQAVVRFGAPIQNQGNVLDGAGARRAMRHWALQLRRHLERLRT
ncbi:MAG: DUF3313 family protein [Myxococcota bacterium]